ncbi:TetR/AcrR family transcriptional regulator [uncultured Pseudokineococcus sp.]|uniref:TetR/AcrR family transcriptional regulator n=1 Tax=uncultured Pseudokineococcus sp. TaxID=1642928 RepID=UPI00260BDCA5|nr:TetR/AcrR family transcriptional regulator [uncultured Pseudokineococcus sp.]
MDLRAGHGDLLERPGVRRRCGRRQQRAGCGRRPHLRARRRREQALERTTYHHGDLRNALVGAATTAVRAGGPDGLALREVAREVGVSPNAAYRHFAGRADLLATVAEHARGAMGAAMAERLSAVRPDDDALALARARLAAVGRGYVEWAVAEPGLFGVAFGAPPEAAKADGPPGCVGGPDPWSMLQERLAELDAAGGLGARGRDGADTAAWAAVHGLAVLLIGPLAGLGPAEREVALARVLATVGAGLAA